MAAYSGTHSRLSHFYHRYMATALASTHYWRTTLTCVQVRWLSTMYHPFSHSSQTAGLFQHLLHFLSVQAEMHVRPGAAVVAVQS